MKVAPDAALDDGWFDVITLGDFGFADLLLRGLDIYSGKHLTNPKVTVHRARKIEAAPARRRRGAARRRRRSARPPAGDLRAPRRRAAGREPQAWPRRSAAAASATRDASLQAARAPRRRCSRASGSSRPASRRRRHAALSELRRLRHLAARPGSRWCRSSAVALHPTTKRPAFYGFVCGPRSPTAAASTGSSASCSASATCRSSPRSRSSCCSSRYQAITFARLRLGACAGSTIASTPASPSSRRWSTSRCELVVPFVFPWYLAITQAWVRPVIQIADLTGPLGVSFLLVLSNARALRRVCRAGAATRRCRCAARRRRRPPRRSRSATAWCASTR